MGGFRPLVVFWAVVIGVLGGGAIGLQVLGPPERPVHRAHGDAPAHSTDKPASVPARVLPSVADPAPAARLTLASIPDPDARLQEASTLLARRTLPRIDAAGRMAAILYAAAFDPSERHPRIALVLQGAGLDQGLTAQANRSLPAAIDFAFSAYAVVADAAALAQAARRAGRECLVSIPMEPAGFPASEEGDRSLLTGADPAQIASNLDFALSGVQGCVGATGASDGLAGERFAESRQAFGDLLATVFHRGLVYLDPRPAAPAPPAGLSGRLYVADALVDRAPAADLPADGQAIDRSLAILEQIAARRGYAIGLAGPATPVLLDRLAVWSQGLAARGLVLAPLTALPGRPLAAAVAHE